MEVEETKKTLKEQIDSYKQYVENKLKDKDADKTDWHSISDAANDIRELVAKLEILRSLPNDH